MKTKFSSLNFTLFSFSRKTLLILFLAFLTSIALFLRLWKFSEWFLFMIDEDLTSFLIKRMLFEKKPLLVGLPFPGEIYPGPLSYYMRAFVMILSGMNPLGQTVFSSLISIITIPLIYFVAKIIFRSSNIGLFAAILYTFSYLVNIHNRAFNTLVMGPISALIVYLALYKIIKEKKINWVYPLAFALILAAQTDGSNLSLIVLTLFIWLIYQLPIRHHKVFRAIGIFLLSHITVLIFDIRHNFVATKALIRFFSFKRPSVINLKAFLEAILLLPRTLARIFFISGPVDLTKQILPCKKYLILIDRELPPAYLIFAWFILIFFVLSFFFKRKKSFGLKIINLHLLVLFLGLLAYNLLLPSSGYEWFFVLFFPGFCLIAAYFFEFLWKGNHLLNKACVLGFLLIFSLSNFRTTLKATSSYGFKNKNEAVQYAVEQVEGRDFYLESLGSCFRYGYRYLFWLHGHEPAISYMDYLLAGWLYPKKPVRKKPETGVIIVNWEDKETQGFLEDYENYLKKTYERKTFGKIQILILDESLSGH